MLELTITCILCPLFITLICGLIDYIYYKKGRTTKKMLKKILVVRSSAAFVAGLLIWILCAILICFTK